MECPSSESDHLMYSILGFGKTISSMESLEGACKSSSLDRTFFLGGESSVACRSKSSSALLPRTGGALEAALGLVWRAVLPADGLCIFVEDGVGSSFGAQSGTVDSGWGGSGSP